MKIENRSKFIEYLVANIVDDFDSMFMEFKDYLFDRFSSLTDVELLVIEAALVLRPLQLANRNDDPNGRSLSKELP